MPGVFKRSLFKAPVYEHYGTGIASGLDDRPGYAAGGRIGYAAGSPDPTQENKIEGIVSEGLAQSGKEALFDGQWNAPFANWQTLSVLGQEYQVALYNALQANGITTEVWRKLPEAQKQELAQEFGDQAFEIISQKYNIPIEQLNISFGGDLDKDGNNFTINNTIKSINTQLINTPSGQMDKLVPKMEASIESSLGGLQEDFPNIMDPLPSVVAQEKADEEVLTGGETDPGLFDTGAGLGTLASLPGIQTDEGRTAAIDYLKQAQMETELQDKARRQAIEAGFMNLGAADPVQPWEGMGRATFQAFQEPMAALREREYQLGQDIYTNIRDRVTDDVRRPDQVKFMDYLTGDPAAMKAAKEIYGTASGGSSLSLEDAMGIATDDMSPASLMTWYNRMDPDNPVTMEEVKADPQKYIEMYAQYLQTLSLTNPGALMQQSIAQGKDGGRVGYQQGALVTDPNAQPVSQEMVAAQQGVPPQQGIEATVPTNLTFEELRAALPDYITDNVVQLLVEDKAALAEFVEIKTRTEADDFEDKYRVELNLPEQDEEMIPTTEFA